MFKNLIIPAALFAIFISGSAYADLVIIGHPGDNIGDLDTQSVKKLFLGERKSFPSGHHATPINHVTGSPDRKEFFSSVLRMGEFNHVRYWTHKSSIGGGFSPVEVDSYDAVLSTVSSTPGSISYIDASLVNDSVKVLLTISSFDEV